METMQSTDINSDHHHRHNKKPIRPQSRSSLSQHHHQQQHLNQSQHSHHHLHNHHQQLPKDGGGSTSFDSQAQTSMAYQHKHALHRLRRLKKRSPHRDLVISFVPRLRMSIINMLDFFHRYSQQEQENWITTANKYVKKTSNLQKMTFSNTRVFIGGLEGPVTKEDIEGEFSKFGKLDNVWIAQNPPGFAFIIYESEQDAEDAVNKMNGETFMGSKIRVEHSKPKRRGPPRRDYGNMRGGRGSYGSSSYNGGSVGGRYSSGGGGGAPYDERGHRYGSSGDRGDRRDDRSFDRGGYGKTNYQSNGSHYRENRRGGYDSRPREYRGSSDRHSSPPRYD